MTGKRETITPILRKEDLGNYGLVSLMSVPGKIRADPPGSYVEAHERHGGDLRWPTQSLHQ